MLFLFQDKLVEKVMKSLNSTDAEDRRTTLKTLAGISQGNAEISGQAEVIKHHYHYILVSVVHASMS